MKPSRAQIERVLCLASSWWADRRQNQTWCRAFVDISAERMWRGVNRGVVRDATDEQLEQLVRDLVDWETRVGRSDDEPWPDLRRYTVLLDVAAVGAEAGDWVKQGRRPFDKEPIRCAFCGCEFISPEEVRPALADLCLCQGKGSKARALTRWVEAAMQDYEGDEPALFQLMHALNDHVQRAFIADAIRQCRQPKEGA